MPALQPIVKKLTRSNFLIWKALVMSMLKRALLSKFLEGKTDVPKQTLPSDVKNMKMPNPEFAIFIAK
jgi:hypothetical protein